MRVRIDWESDALYIRLCEEPIAESEEVREGVILDYAKDESLIGIELLNIRQRFKLKDLTQISVEMPVVQ